MIKRLKRAFLLLDAGSRLRWAGLIPLSFLEGLAESLGAAGVFTLIRIIDEPGRIFDLPVIGYLYTAVGWTDGKTVIFSFTAIITVYYILKNIFLTLSVFIRSRLTSVTVEKLSTTLFGSYLEAPYTLHLQRNSSDLIDRMTRSVEMTVRMTLESGVAFMSEILVLCGIAVVLVMASPMMTLISLGLLAGLLTIMLAGTHRLFFRMGAREQTFRQGSLETIHQTLGGIKEVKVMGREFYCYERFARFQSGMARVRKWHATLDSVPRAIVETVFICIPLVMVVLSLGRPQRGADGVLPLLGLFAYAGFRAIPSFNRMALRVNDIRYGGREVELLCRDLELLGNWGKGHTPTGVEPAPMSFRKELLLERVSYFYEEQGMPVLRHVSFQVGKGESVGIAGVTGSGKSTILDLILGLLTPSEGEITVDGVSIFENLGGWRRLIGYVPQQIYLTDDTLRRNIAFGVADGEILEACIQRAVGLAQLEGFLASLPRGLETRLGERGVKISGGERQRVAIARALYREPELIIFDEATSALDRYTERALTEALRALHGHKTMIVVAHRLSTLRHCDKVIFLHEGHIQASGTLESLMAESPAFRRLASAA